MESGRFPLMSIPPFGRGFSRHRGLPIRCDCLKSAEAKPPRSAHRLDEPTGLSLSMVTSPPCRFRFARQNHCSAAATERGQLPDGPSSERNQLARWQYAPGKPFNSRGPSSPRGKADLSHRRPLSAGWRGSPGIRSSCSARDIDRGCCSHRCVSRPPIWAFRSLTLVLSWSGRKQASRGKPRKLVTREVPALGYDTLPSRLYLCFECLRVGVAGFTALAARRTSSFVNTARRNGCDSRK